MKRLYILAMLVSMLAAFGAPAVIAGAAKVEVCHIPPGNPDNFHTIRISENAFATHLAHGDIAGPCDAACATLCDDGDACTIDDTGDCEQIGCPVTQQMVDCNDDNTCTTDSCEPTSGCVNTPEVGAPCDDGETCTGFDTCDVNGACNGTIIPNCCLDNNDCSPDPCDNASCNTGIHECENNPVVCVPSDLCHVNVCDSTTGDCSETPVVCGEGETCNADTGECEDDVVSCPCYGKTVGTTTWTLDFPAEYGSNTPTTNIQVGYGVRALQANKPSPSVDGSCQILQGSLLPVTQTTNQAQHEACYAELLEIGVNRGIFNPIP